MIKQINKTGGCSWIEKNSSKEFEDGQIYPDNICPLLYYSCYPYMLGLLFGADFMHSKEGDANVSCPALNGVKAFVRKRNIPCEITDEKITKDMKFVIYIDIVGVGKCPLNHKINDKFIFPSSMKENYLCPAAWYNSFPFLAKKYLHFECLDETTVKCPDWDRTDIILNIKDTT